jgi:hypothetical protein
MKIAAMLGRLSDKYNQPLQSFPIKAWEEEFDINKLRDDKIT